MLSKNRNTIIITLASMVSLISLGGTVNAQQYQYPPSNLTVQNQQYLAPIATQVTKPATNTQVRIIRDAPPVVAYPMQRNNSYGAIPYSNANVMPRPRAVPVPQMRYAPPRNQAPVYNRAYNNRPVYGNPYRPYNRVPNNPYYGYNPYNRRPSNNNPFNNFGGGPFTGNNAPWEEWPFGAPDSFWNRKELPFKAQNPVDWFQPADPKEGMAVMWDDLIAAPDDLGTMPGGWTVPSISVPNPVDLEDQLEQASKEIPDLIRIYSE